MQRRREVEHSHALPSITFFLFFIIFFLSSSSSSYEELTDKGDLHKQNFEVLALLEIKSSLIDPHGVLANWDGTVMDPCSWNMIACSVDGFVIDLEFPSQNLSGTLSPSIGNLTNLETVLLENNYITGHIPQEIGNLMKLKTLDLSTNNFTGQIPSTLSHITNLQYLRLNNNSLTGTIPSSLANMTRLTFLDFSYNNLSGPVPRSLAIRPITFNVMGNPQICPTGIEKDCNPSSITLNSSQNETSHGGTKNPKMAVAFGLSLTCVLLVDPWLWFSPLVERRKTQQLTFDINAKKGENVSREGSKEFQRTTIRRELQSI